MNDWQVKKAMAEQHLERDPLEDFFPRDQLTTDVCELAELER